LPLIYRFTARPVALMADILSAREALTQADAAEIPLAVCVPARAAHLLDIIRLLLRVCR
jgi:hypothetical protein